MYDKVTPDQIQSTITSFIMMLDQAQQMLVDEVEEANETPPMKCKKELIDLIDRGIWRSPDHLK